MKTLRESLLDDDLIGKTDKMIKDEIKSFLKENYTGVSLCKISRKPNSDGKYEVSSPKHIEVKNNNITSLTNGMFIWTTVDKYFVIRDCKFLESLDGAPREVGGSFNCSDCNSLISLKGAPEKVGGHFDCSYCTSLKSLNGAPKEIGGDFSCNNCDSLKSLEGSPEKVGRDFNCSDCNSLISLKGAPKEVGKYFYCFRCKVKFTEDDIKKVSNVKGKIYYSK